MSDLRDRALAASKKPKGERTAEDEAAIREYARSAEGKAAATLARARLSREADQAAAKRVPAARAPSNAPPASTGALPVTPRKLCPVTARDDNGVLHQCYQYDDHALHVCSVACGATWKSGEKPSKPKGRKKAH